MRLAAVVDWLLGPEPPAETRPGHLWPRWIFLRALGLIYLSAFYSFLFQIKGLIGPNGILPARDYLQAVAAAFHVSRFWFAPTLLWFGSSDRALMCVCWLGIVASLLLAANVWPRATLAICFLCFLSFVAAAQDFSSYQSDGMLLEAGFIAFFFAPAGWWPGLGRWQPPSRASLFLLRWEWFRIYFESGIVKVASGDASWHHFTAMQDYYQNCPLPTWIGWYVQHFPHWFHTSTVVLIFAVELVLVWMLFLPRPFRIACFWIVTSFQICIILTANYAFLNYIVLSLGFLLLDDRFIEWILPARIRNFLSKSPPGVTAGEAPAGAWRLRWRTARASLDRLLAGVCLGMVFYATTVQLLWMFFPGLPFPASLVRRLEPFRIADRYGLFAVMTHARYELEFQGTRDGKTWIAYPFRYKPQDPRKAPGIYAPYQPRFEWNLWFASLGSWQDYRWVVWTEERLLQNQPDVLALFAGNPFATAPPREVRLVLWQYWFTDATTKRDQGAWWRREELGEYAPPLEREPSGRIVMLNVPIPRVPPP
ncbi:MAG TPA: lipase maturation factor family protein [Candidatus Acidoferrales bacterium]|nr:lipase maturation factor family protein [Candidatus Acidoferrales bacterium]